MATNKFATMLHRNTPRLVVILVYAALEWVLIFLLLINSLFSYLITKFANYCGLKKPCLWCSRVSHILEPGNNTNSYRDLVCESHATEISKLDYCLDHQKLAESHNMCKECSSSQPTEMSQTATFLSWMEENKTENDEKNNRCSCCNEILKGSELYSPFLMFKSSWGVLDCTQKRSLSVKDDDNGSEYSDRCKNYGIEGNKEHQILSNMGNFSFREAVEEDCSRSLSIFESHEKERSEEEETRIHQDSNASVEHVHQDSDDIVTQIYSRKDDSLEIISPRSENYVDCDCNRLTPLEFIDSSTITAILRVRDPKKHHQQEGTVNSGILRVRDPKKHHQQEGTVNSGSVFEFRFNVSQEVELPRMNGSTEKTRFEDMAEMEGSSLDKAELSKGDLAGTTNEDDNDVKAEDMEETDDCPALKLFHNETKSHILTVKEVCGHGATNQTQAQDPVLPLSCLHDLSSMNTNDGADVFLASNDQGPRQIEKKTMLQETAILLNRKEGIKQHVSVQSEHNEAEEENFPDTPSSIEALNQLNKKLQQFEKVELGRDESLHGTDQASEMEGVDGVLTNERLEAALLAERKVLSALYAELEEERSASAIAANQTMAMITRLQEEKSAMQMEALQYQRMMEEQSEYDQEALQLLNELMIKREKEKQELEKELEVYRKKVLDYETKEKIMISRRRKEESLKSRNSSSCSNAGDSDEISIDLNHEGRDEESSFFNHQESSNNNTPADANPNLEELGLDTVNNMSTLDESLVGFEEERLSILEQLKALEEKLFTLGDDEQCFEDVKPIEHFSDYIEELDEDYHLNGQEENGDANGFSESKSREREKMGSIPKRLLPLFDAVAMETEEGIEQVESDSGGILNSLVSNSELEKKRFAVEEEVDHVYERLQALEADREFLRHCISSLKKGDKGMDLLQEILQHLRDLRTVEIRVRNMGDSPLG